jgi:hypothetical protein
MRESRTYGSVRGALSNGRPYRVRLLLAALQESGIGPNRRFSNVRFCTAAGGKADIPRSTRRGSGPRLQ